MNCEEGADLRTARILVPVANCTSFCIAYDVVPVPEENFPILIRTRGRNSNNGMDTFQAKRFRPFLYNVYIWTLTALHGVCA